MDIIGHIEKNWEAIMKNPGLFIIMFMICFASTFFFNRWYFKDTIDKLGTTISDYESRKTLGLDNDQTTNSKLPDKEVSISDEGWDAEKISVINKTFMNERVQVDGHSYINCTFENVTFVYDGTGPYDFLGNTIKGSRYLSVGPSPPLFGMLKLQEMLGLLKTGIVEK